MASWDLKHPRVLGWSLYGNSRITDWSLKMKSVVRNISERAKMYCFGKAAVTCLVISVLMMLLRPGWGSSSLRALVGRLMYFSFFAAPVFGVVGIINDRRKFFAIASVATALGVVLFLLVCQWLSMYYENMLQWTPPALMACMFVAEHQQSTEGWKEKWSLYKRRQRRSVLWMLRLDSR